MSVQVLCDEVGADGVAEQIEELALGADAAGALEVAMVVDGAVDGLGVLAPSVDELVARVSGWDLADGLKRCDPIDRVADPMSMYDRCKSESAAARACITAARTLRDTLPEVAARSELPAAEVSLRFGLHWGATLYMGRILTGGRSEVTALGDEMNEAARIEACATGGRTLASKSLIERLNRTDADTLGLDTVHTTYTPLADLSTATDKARRDAPSIAVCEV